MNNPEGRKRLLLIGAGIIGCIVILSILFALFGPKSAEERKVAEPLPANTPAAIENGGKAFNALGESAYYELRVNLGAFFAQQYSNNELTSFKVTKVVSSDTSKKSIEFEGEFRGKSKTYLIKAAAAPNSQISLEISEAKSGKAIEATLPANSKESAYVRTLPIDRETYTITYDDDTNEFVLQMFDDTTENRAKAAEELKAGLGVASLDGIAYRYFYPSSFFRGEVSE